MLGARAAAAESSTHSHSQHPLRFNRFSNDLYCAGSETQSCPHGLTAGTCYWFKSGNRPVVAEDLNKTLKGTGFVNNRMPGDQWDPARAGERSFRYFGRPAASACVRGKRVFFAGDSTTRDTFYEFGAVAGHPLFSDPFPQSPQQYWPDSAHSPRSPHSSGGRDRRGMCLGNFDQKKTCLRDERHPAGAGQPETRLGFQFLSRGNASWEVDQMVTMLSDRAPSHAVVQCPFYEWFRPDACAREPRAKISLPSRGGSLIGKARLPSPSRYNYSLTKAQRARLAVVDQKVGPRHFEGIGRSCLQYVERLRRLPGGEATAIFLLGTTPLPGWTRDLGGHDVEAKVFRSINRGLGIHCHRRSANATAARGTAGAHEWALTSQHRIVPIDRYASVGIRRRDMIHPFFNAQFAAVQLLLNHMCPATSPANGTA
jgi:hypothetical protein